MHIKEKIVVFLLLFAIGAPSQTYSDALKGVFSPQMSPSRRGDVVITELMVNPSDQFGLPPYEYIELFNTTDDVINLSGWTLVMKNTVARLSACVLQPSQYVTVCGQTHLADFAGFSPISAVPWPTLTNSGGTISLHDALGTTVDFVRYSYSFYHDVAKQSGGWSLERVDPYNLSNDDLNWRASVSPHGGTPSAENSVASTYIDQTVPQLLSVRTDDSGATLYVEMSEPVEFVGNTVFIDGVKQSFVLQTVSDDALDRFALHLASPLSRHSVHEVSGLAVEDLAGNSLPDCSWRVAITEPMSMDALIINEVMSKASLAAYDYVEVFNRGDDSYDLHEICFGVVRSDALAECHRITSYCRTIFPGDYIVLCNDSLGHATHYSPQHPEWIVANSHFSNLSAEGSFALALPDGTITDRLDYSDHLHSMLLKDRKDVALERILSSASTDDASNWTSAAELYGYATPTARNSQNRDDREDISTDIEMTVKVFSPDGDGIDDEMLLSTRFGDGEWNATLKIFNSAGDLVAQPYSNSLMPVTGELKWNGRSDDGVTLAPGIYVVYLSAWQTAGKTRHYKRTCTLRYPHQ